MMATVLLQAKPLEFIDFAARVRDTLNSMKNGEFRYGGGVNYSQSMGVYEYIMNIETG